MHFMQQKNLKRWLCCLLLLCSFATAQSQALQKAEYFFDTDPGVGNGTVLNISSTPLIIDSTFTFDVSLLTSGLHTIYIRVQDAGLHWSLNYATSFLKTIVTSYHRDNWRISFFISVLLNEK